MRKFFLLLGIFAVCSILGPRSFGGTEATRSSSEARSRSGITSASKVPTFTLDQAILTALQQNPALLNAEQEIKRTKGVIIQVRAQALPQITAQGNFEWTDPNVQGAGIRENPRRGTGVTRGRGSGAASLMQGLASRGREIQPPLAAAGAAAASPTPPIITATEASDVSYAISVLG